jgi:hypothetical protein
MKWPFLRREPENTGFFTQSVQEYNKPANFETHRQCGMVLNTKWITSESQTRNIRISFQQLKVELMNERASQLSQVGCGIKFAICRLSCGCDRQSSEQS